MSVKTKGIIWYSSFCYLNSAIQLIYHIKEFRNFFINTKFDDTYKIYLSEDYLDKNIYNIKQLNNLDKNFLLSIQKIMMEFDNSLSNNIDYKQIFIDTETVDKHIGRYLEILPNFRVGEQQDTTEFFFCVLNFIYNVIDMKFANKIMFSETLISKCKNSDHTFIKNIKKSYLVLYIPNNFFYKNTSIQELIDVSLNETIIDTSNVMDCVNNNNGNDDYYHKKSITYKILPLQKYFIINIPTKVTPVTYPCKDITEDIEIKLEDLIGDKIPDKIYINKLLDDKKEVLKKNIMITI